MEVSGIQNPGSRTSLVDQGRKVKVTTSVFGGIYLRCCHSDVKWTLAHGARMKMGHLCGRVKGQRPVNATEEVGSTLRNSPRPGPSRRETHCKGARDAVTERQEGNWAGIVSYSPEDIKESEAGSPREMEEAGE